MGVVLIGGLVLINIIRYNSCLIDLLPPPITLHILLLNTRQTLKINAM